MSSVRVERTFFLCALRQWVDKEFGSTTRVDLEVQGTGDVVLPELSGTTSNQCQSVMRT